MPGYDPGLNHPRSQFQIHKEHYPSHKLTVQSANEYTQKGTTELVLLAAALDGPAWRPDAECALQFAVGQVMGQHQPQEYFGYL